MSTVATITTDAAALPSFVIDPPQRLRRPYKRMDVDGEPDVVTLPGGAVAVALFGSRAAGRSMVLDADVWRDLAADGNTGWVVNAAHGYEYVRSGGRQHARAARQPGRCPTVTLARLILDARPREQVSYRNGDHLDLRRSNLCFEHRTRAGSAARG